MIQLNRYPGGVRKVLTFSFDDGPIHDVRMMALLDKYGMKGTFHINGANLQGKSEEELLAFRKRYEGHEIAVHTLDHPLLPAIEDEKEIIRQVEQDRLNLSEIAGYEIVGMAYPCGGVNNDDRVAEIIKNNTGVKYSRTITSSHNFDLQDNLYRFNPSIHVVASWKESMEKAQEFVSMKTESPKIFYIWGHAYEFDADPSYWDRIDEFCKLISGKEDIFYGTNTDILLK
jgi:peptidoglycan/xylan/chitin deacetylase (PgdA/CDA1 family)